MKIVKLNLRRMKSEIHNLHNHNSRRVNHRLCCYGGMGVDVIHLSEFKLTAEDVREMASHHTTLSKPYYYWGQGVPRDLKEEVKHSENQCFTRRKPLTKLALRQRVRKVFKERGLRNEK